MFLYGLLIYVDDNNEYDIDKNEAIQYLKMSAENGDDNAMLLYGEMLYYGEDIPIDKKSS